MLRGRTSRRDISICAFCQHRLSLSSRLASPRHRTFSNARVLHNNGSSGPSGWTPPGSTPRPRGPIAGGSWGTPAFTARRIPPSPPTPPLEPTRKPESRSEPEPTTGRGPPAGDSEQNGSPAPRPPPPSPSTPNAPAPNLWLNEHEMNARKKLLSKQAAERRAQSEFGTREQHLKLRSNNVFQPTRQSNIEDALRTEKRGLKDLGSLLRKPATPKPGIDFSNADLGAGKTRPPGLGKLVEDNRFWAHKPEQTPNPSTPSPTPTPTSTRNPTQTPTPSPSSSSSSSSSSWGSIGRSALLQNSQLANIRKRLMSSPDNPQGSPNIQAAQTGNWNEKSSAGVAAAPPSPNNVRASQTTGGWGSMARKNKPAAADAEEFWNSISVKVELPKEVTRNGFNKDLSFSGKSQAIDPGHDWGREFDKPEEPKATTIQDTSATQPTTTEESTTEASTERKSTTKPKTKEPKSEENTPWDAEKPKKEKPAKKNRKQPVKRKKRRAQNDLDDSEYIPEIDIYEELVEEERMKQLRKEQRKPERTGPIPILIPELISITALADALKIQHDEFLVQLGELGFEGVTLDSLMAGETAALVAQEYGYEPTLDDGGDRDLRPRPPPEDISILPQRPPVVTIMGHVDHGKTTLLDYLRKSSIVSQEHGGITQHIGAFSVTLSSGKPITFLDTPGHAAFLTMRQRGANVTDIVVLVVAADDSVKPQTLEALKHAQAAKVPIIVAINKIDAEGAAIDRVKSDLAAVGVEIEDFGGDVQAVCVSGKTGQGMDELEEAILTLSEVLDHRAEVDGQAEGWILESSLKPIGKVATVLVKRGTLRTGDYIAAGVTWAKIRHLRNEKGAIIREAPPGTPVEILGWKDLPAAGDLVIQAPDEGRAKTAVEYRKGLREREQDAAAYEVIAEARKTLQEKREREKNKPKDAEDEEVAVAEESGPKIVNFVVKGDVHGSVEAVCASILEIGNHEVQPRVLRSATGPVTESDVEHAATSGSTIVNFATTTPGHVVRLAEEKGVKIMDHNVIYHLVDDVTAELSRHLAPEVTTRTLGEAEVMQLFPINTHKRVYKTVAGCRVRTGTVSRGNLYKIMRKNKEVFNGKLETLKHHKKDVMEMQKGTECGMGFEDFQDLAVGDIIQAYEEIVTPRSLQPQPDKDDWKR
ncbi:hypothetical protein F4809DRAFT_619753 [Biscogniauxia mediterranea]|nr:hypothetical protein F4809DRAFT_619753 [Biscogniauxia mediterranea]